MKPRTRARMRRNTFWLSRWNQIGQREWKNHRPNNQFNEMDIWNNRQTNISTHCKWSNKTIQIIPMFPWRSVPSVIHSLTVCPWIATDVVVDCGWLLFPYGSISRSKSVWMPLRLNVAMPFISIFGQKPFLIFFWHYTLKGWA